MSQPQTYTKLTNLEVLNFARDWYAALDRHDPIEEVLGYLDPDDLVLNFPEGTFHGIDGFRGWYDAVTHRFFDEAHRLDSVQVDLGTDPGRAQVAVNWQARCWDPPAAASTWLGFDADQTWTVTAEGGRLRILEYTVNDLKPMPGSGSL
jgi:hypothetical protein